MLRSEMFTFVAVSLPQTGNPKHQLGHGAGGTPCHIPKLVLGVPRPGRWNDE